MELQFRKTQCSCLDTCLRELQNAEETLEIRVPDGMPDIGRILAAWGQPILRSKEWRSEQISFSGGMMVWVLYAPEDGSEEKCIEGWIPFQMRWELPEGTREGQIRIGLNSRFVDARSTSARKIMVRAGLAALAEAWVPRVEELALPEEPVQGVEMLRRRYPVRLRKEAGEKAFLLSEDLNLPGSAPQPEKLLYYTVRPEVTDQKVIANKVVFRGNGNLHLLYAAEDGQLHSWDFPLAFSQYGEMEESYGSDAQADVKVCTTSVELELDDEGLLRLKCGMVGQYLVDEQNLLEVVADAYSPGRALQPQIQQLRLPVVLDSRRENIYGEQTIPGAANIAVDTQFLADYPRQRVLEDEVQLELPGAMQVLYYDENGALQSAAARFEKMQTLKADRSSTLAVSPLTAQEPQVILGTDSMEARWEQPLQLTAMGSTEIPMVTALEIGEPVPTDPNRPSLILKRVGKTGLWDIAKEADSTMEAIQKANGLSDEPVPGQMLLIPVRE